MKKLQLYTAGLMLGALSLPAAYAQVNLVRAASVQYSAVTEQGNELEQVTIIPPLRITEPQSRVIDLAICLDTSGSMDGLIDSAKQRLWSIVNDLALAKPAPELRVALLTYGNDGHAPENGWVRVDSELTTDLDLISQRLFELRTNGGTELVGRVISVATGKLNWSNDPAALKIAVVAGNESADQDSVVSFRDACATAIGQGIMVNSIYCGNPADAEAPLWKQVSMLADGHFVTIDHQSGTLAINTPFDDQLLALTTSVNRTYLPFGSDGETAWVNQSVQDSNAIRLNNDAAANRAMCKNGSLYVCAWDLVDASKEEGFDLTKIEVAQLPENMRLMTLEQQQVHIDEAATQRGEIQKQIADVGTQRQAWLDTEMQRRSLDEEQSFDHQLRGAIRKQVSTRGFQFPAVVAPVVPAMPIVETAAGAVVVPPAAGPSQQGAVQQGAVQQGAVQQGAVQQSGQQRVIAPQQQTGAAGSTTPPANASGNSPASNASGASAPPAPVQVKQVKRQGEAPPIVPEDC